MSSEPAPLATPLGRRRAILTLAAGTAAALHGGWPRAWAQGHGGGAGQTTDEAHDRQGWSAGRKADEAVRRASRARFTLEDILERREETGWCPKTREEWEQVLDAVACYLALRDLWRSLGYDVYEPDKVDFADAFKGSPQGDDASRARHARGEAMKAAFKDAKELRDDLYELIGKCDKDKAPVMAFGLDQAVRTRAEQKKAHELGLIGMGPLLIVDCPDCRPKRGIIMTPGGRLQMDR